MRWTHWQPRRCVPHPLTHSLPSPAWQPTPFLPTSFHQWVTSPLPQQWTCPPAPLPTCLTRLAHQPEAEIRACFRSHLPFIHWLACSHPHSLFLRTTTTTTTLCSRADGAARRASLASARARGGAWGQPRASALERHGQRLGLQVMGDGRTAFHRGRPAA
jgi:hypothetical protein